MHHGAVDLLERRLVVRDHVQHLAPDGLLQPVGDERRHLAAEPHHLLALLGVEGRGAVDGLSARLLAADDLDERDQVRRVERVPDDGPLGWRSRAGCRS